MSHAKPLFSRTYSRLAGYEKVRFAFVGVINTLVDFSIFLSLAMALHVPTFWANIVSTSCALAVSFLLNKRAVFGNTDTNNKKQIALFIIVTLTGLWIIQPIIIYFAASWLLALVSTSWVLLFAKLLATCVSLVWNYLWYSRVVFPKKAS